MRHSTKNVRHRAAQFWAAFLFAKYNLVCDVKCKILQLYCTKLHESFYNFIVRIQVSENLGNYLISGLRKEPEKAIT